mmetsp:Transcript_13303/g.32577  ORF Transcript_13303/g.32577 Transcript_13303/m.32577 type:complete len:301 (+) Transcript_13303:4589-5491(+)
MKEASVVYFHLQLLVIRCAGDGKFHRLHRRVRKPRPALVLSYRARMPPLLVIRRRPPRRNVGQVDTPQTSATSILFSGKRRAPLAARYRDFDVATATGRRGRKSSCTLLAALLCGYADAVRQFVEGVGAVLGVRTVPAPPCPHAPSSDATTAPARRTTLPSSRSRTSTVSRTVIVASHASIRPHRTDRSSVRPFQLDSRARPRRHAISFFCAFRLRVAVSASVFGCAARGLLVLCARRLEDVRQVHPARARTSRSILSLSWKVGKPVAIRRTDDSVLPNEVAVVPLRREGLRREALPVPT